MNRPDRRYWLDTTYDRLDRMKLVELVRDLGYHLDDDELAKVAHETFARLGSAPESPDHLDPADLSPDDNHALSRGIGILTKQADPLGLNRVAQLFEYAPHLSHRLGTYLVALHEAGTDVGPTWDTLVTRSDFFNAWQRVWLVYIARVGKLLTDPPVMRGSSRNERIPIRCCEPKPLWLWPRTSWPLSMRSTVRSGQNPKGSSPGTPWRPKRSPTSTRSGCGPSKTVMD